MAIWRVFKKEANRTRYTIAGKDHLGVEQQMPAFAHEDLSIELARNVATLVEHKRHNSAPPPLLAMWLQGLAPDIKAKFIEFGLLDWGAKPITEHVTDFEAALKAKGNTPAYVTQTIYRINSIIHGCKLVHWPDMQASRVQAFIAGLRRSKTLAATAQTQNAYLRDFKSFCRWAVADGRLSQSPVEYLRPLSAAKVRNDVRHERRALSVEEAVILLTTTQMQPERNEMSGIERALLYRLAIETGLRASEMRSLTRGSFVLEGEEPTVTVQGAYTKNREVAVIPLRLDTALELKAHLANKLPAAAVFNMPSKYRIIDMLRADLKAAGIPYALDEKHGKVVDFHSLRHTCGSWLAAAGTHPKVIQRIMRHSTITLTMDRYAHAFKGDEAAAVAKLPSLATLPATPRTLVPTGTDGRSANTYRPNATGRDTCQRGRNVGELAGRAAGRNG